MELPAGRENAPWNLRVISPPFPLTDLCTEESAFPCLFVIILYLNFILQWRSYRFSKATNTPVRNCWNSCSGGPVFLSFSGDKSMPPPTAARRVLIWIGEITHVQLWRASLEILVRGCMEMLVKYIIPAWQCNSLISAPPARDPGGCWKTESQSEGGAERGSYQIANKTFRSRFVKLFYE